MRQAQPQLRQALPVGDKEERALVVPALQLAVGEHERASEPPPQKPRIERQPATEDIYTTNLLTHQRIIRPAEVRGRSFVGRFSFHGIAKLQPKEAATWLNRGI